MSKLLQKLMVSAGELSGDEHAAHVVNALRRLNPALDVRGMGGRNLRCAGAQTFVDSEVSASVMGFGDVLRALPKILNSLSQMKAEIRSWRPDALLLVDYADFNLRLADYARRQSVKTVYYIPPTVWAWRPQRLHQIKRSVSSAALIYPFEKKFYLDRGYKGAYYVGHPLCDSPLAQEISTREKFEWRRSHGFNVERPLVALFPGSRPAEIKRHLEPLLACVRELRGLRPEAQFALAAAPTISSAELGTAEQAGLGIKVINGESVNILRFSDAGLLKSGTSNLQAAFCGLPFAMFYSASKFSELVVRSMVSVREFSIVNLIRSGTVIEFLQNRASPLEMAGEISALLSDPTRRGQVVDGLREVRDALRSFDKDPIFSGCTSCAQRVAALVHATASSSG